MSKNALRAFVERILTNQTLCPEIVEDKLSEDQTTTRCWSKINVYPVDGRDILKKDRFLMNTPERHLFSQMDSWYFRQRYYRSEEGINCCSNYTISFHKITPNHLYTLYFLSYLLKLYGISYQYPPLPAKVKLADSIRILELERVNVALRGY